MKWQVSRTVGKVLVRDEPLASILQEGLEGFASGRFGSQAELKRFLESKPDFPKDLPNGELRAQTVLRLLNKEVYAGMVFCKKWGISLRQGRHEPLISIETHQRILRRLEQGAYAPARKDLNRDFVLRGAVACSGCGTNLRSSWSKGLNEYFPYYLCQTKGCEFYGKSIRRADIEGQFEDILKKVQPSENLIRVTMAMFKSYWDRKVNEAQDSAQAFTNKIQETEQEVQKLIKRITKSGNDRVISALENRIEELEHKKLILAEKSQNVANPQPTFSENLELALKFLANPYRVWRTGNFDMRRIVLKLVFPEPLRYCKSKGYRTPNLSLPFKVLDGNFDQFLPVLQDGAAGEN